MLPQKIRFKVLFLFCIIFFHPKHIVASNNFASQSSREYLGSHIFEQREVQKAISRFCRILLLNPKNKTVQENFKAIVAYPDLTAKQRSNVYRLEDLLSYIKNLKKRIRYLTSKRDLFKKQLIKNSYAQEWFFQDLLAINKNMFRSHEMFRSQEKPHYDQKDPLTFIGRLLTDEKEQLFVHVQHLQKQYQWLKKISKNQKSSVPPPFIHFPKITTPVLSNNIVQSKIHEYASHNLEDVESGKDSIKGAGGEQFHLGDDDQPEATTNVIYVHPKVVDEQLEKFQEMLPQMTSLLVGPAHQDEELNIGEDIQDPHSEEFKENLKEKDNKINELSGQVVDLSLKMSETEMILNKKIEAIAFLKKELVEVEQRFMLEQKIIQEKNQEMQYLQDTLDRFQLKSVDHIEEESNESIAKNGQFAGIETFLKDHQNDLEKSNDLIKKEVKNIKVIGKELIQAQGELELKQKIIHEKSEQITALQSELTLAQLKVQKSSDEADVLLMKKDREIEELNALLNSYKHSLRNSNQIIKARSVQFIELNMELAKLRKEVDHNKNGYQQRGSKIRVLKESLSSDERLNELNGILEIYKYKLGKKTRATKEKEQSIVFLEGRLDSLQSTLQEKSDALVETQRDLLSLKVQLMDVQNELLKLKDQSNALESQGPVIESKVQELQSKFQNIQHFLLRYRHDSDRINEPSESFFNRGAHEGSNIRKNTPNPQINTHLAVQ